MIIEKFIRNARMGCCSLVTEEKTLTPDPNKTKKWRVNISKQWYVKRTSKLRLNWKFIQNRKQEDKENKRKRYLSVCLTFLSDPLNFRKKRNKYKHDLETKQRNQTNEWIPLLLFDSHHSIRGHLFWQVSSHSLIFQEWNKTQIKWIEQVHSTILISCLFQQATYSKKQESKSNSFGKENIEFSISIAWA